MNDRVKEDVDICEWNGRTLSEFHDLVFMYGGGYRCAKCKKEFNITPLAPVVSHTFSHSNEAKQ